MSKENKITIFDTKKLVLTAVFSALTAVATIVVQIPLPFGYVNLGDVFVLLSAFILGSFYGVASAGIGSALADIISGYAIYAPGTFIIKCLMAYVAYIMVKLLNGKIKVNIVLQIIAGIVAELIMVTGYFFYDAVVLSYSWSAAASIVGNLIQGGVAITVSVLVMALLNKRKIFLDSSVEKEDK